jgi:hypothetical protein
MENDNKKINDIIGTKLITWPNGCHITHFQIYMQIPIPLT